MGVVGSRWSVVGARWAFESVGMVTASADGSFDFAQDDGWGWSVVGTRWAFPSLAGRLSVFSSEGCGKTVKPPFGRKGKPRSARANPRLSGPPPSKGRGARMSITRPSGTLFAEEGLIGKASPFYTPPFGHPLQRRGLDR